MFRNFKGIKVVEKNGKGGVYEKQVLQRRNS